MRHSSISFAVAYSVLLILSTAAHAQDYLKLRNGEVINCAILSQDSTAVYTTDWEMRQLPQPPLRVYTRSEIESIWFVPPTTQKSRIPYRPSSSGLNGGGGLAFQTWASSDSARRSLLMLSLQGGFDFVRQAGLEAEADLTVPMGGKSLSSWKDLNAAYQVLMNFKLHPWIVKGAVPFAIAGGGSSLTVPEGGLLWTSKNDIHGVLDFGLGVEWGSNGIGYRVEWRHYFYNWHPNDLDSNGRRLKAKTADASIIRTSLFLYR
jgi:hypothetical protein